MKKIMLIGSRLKVTIENDWITMDHLGHDRRMDVKIPMSYCSILDFDTGPKKDSAVIVNLKMKRWVRHPDIHRAEDRNRQIVLPHCVHREEDGVIKCYFTDGGLPRGMKYLLSSVEYINYEYLKLHEDDIIAIRDISRTMQSIGKARKIIGMESDRGNAGRRESDYFSRLHRDAIDQETENRY